MVDDGKCFLFLFGIERRHYIFSLRALESLVYQTDLENCEFRLYNINSSFTRRRITAKSSFPNRELKQRRRRRLFPFRKQAMPFLTVDAIIGNQACHNQ